MISPSHPAPSSAEFDALAIVEARIPAPAPFAGDWNAIALLEEEVIPWQNDGHGAPARQLRENAASHPLFTAEGLLRRGTRTGAPGIGGESGPARPAEFERQRETLVRWAQRNRRLIDRSLEERLDNIGGVEHEVFFDERSGRWVKLTLPGMAGKELQAREEMAGVRPTLQTGDALPSSYLRRLTLANGRLGDDFWLHGVMLHPAGPRTVISQRHIQGTPARPAEIARHFTTAGFRQINAKTFYHTVERLLVSDAHTANVFATEGTLAPFDVCVQRPRGALWRAVQPAADLNFEDGDQLTF